MTKKPTDQIGLIKMCKTHLLHIRTNSVCGVQCWTD